MSLTIKQEKYYVYHLIDPRDDIVFYVGKGCGTRMSHHERDARLFKNKNVLKELKIRQILASGYQIKSKKIFENLGEHEAYIAERESIKQIGIESLLNSQRGICPSSIKSYIEAFGYAWNLVGKIVNKQIPEEKVEFATQLVSEYLQAMKLCVKISGYKAIERALTKVSP